MDRTSSPSKQFEAMGTNRVSVSLSMIDGRDCFQDLYNYCNSLGKDLVVGVTPSGYASATIVYGTKNSDVMQKNQENMYSENGTARTDVELPPDLYYGVINMQSAITISWKRAGT